jgi:glycosyltransferase involved in cell wall biosynthesis
VAQLAVVSFRLGMTDGVSIEAAKWIKGFQSLGHDVRTVAGEGPVDALIPGLAIGAVKGPQRDEIVSALVNADVVVVENICSLPLNPDARDVLYEVLHERPAIFHHHDLPWQREQFLNEPPPRDEPLWHHVVINELSRTQLHTRGVAATLVYNHFDCSPPVGNREATRKALGLDNDVRLFLQPTRALARKNVQASLQVANAHNAVLWLVGDAEDGYGRELQALLEKSAVRVLRGLPGSCSIHDAYAASDLVVMPSTWEGFGNPVLESVTHRRALARYPYPVVVELEKKGFLFLELTDEVGIEEALTKREQPYLENNLALARSEFNEEDLPRILAELLASANVS